MAVGVSSLTIGLVAGRARVSTALVHYHFSTKRKLLLEAVRALAERKMEARVAALGGAGLPGLDALWTALVSGPGAAVERAWPDLVLVARSDPDVRSALGEARERERARLAEPLARLLASLGSRPALPADDLAAAAATFLDGAAGALAAGVSVDDVRASYDAFWLALVALGQAAPGP